MTPSALEIFYMIAEEKATDVLTVSLLYYFFDVPGVPGTHL